MVGPTGNFVLCLKRIGWQPLSARRLLKLHEGTEIDLCMVGPAAVRRLVERRAADVALKAVGFFRGDPLARPVGWVAPDLGSARQLIQKAWKGTGPLSPQEGGTLRSILIGSQWPQSRFHGAS